MLKVFILGEQANEHITKAILALRKVYLKRFRLEAKSFNHGVVLCFSLDLFVYMQ